MSSYILLNALLLCGISLGICQIGFCGIDKPAHELDVFQEKMLASERYIKKGPYIYPSPLTSPKDLQGVKAHIGATPTESKRILEALLPLIVESEYPFKVCAFADNLEYMNETQYKGRFITLYHSQEKIGHPSFKEFLKACDEKLLSLKLNTPLRCAFDKPWGESGAISYRYGSFVSHTLITETEEEDCRVVGFSSDDRFGNSHKPFDHKTILSDDSDSEYEIL